MKDFFDFLAMIAASVMYFFFAMISLIGGALAFAAVFTISLALQPAVWLAAIFFLLLVKLF